MAANAARIIKALVPPTGYHFGTLPLGQGSRVVTSYISVDKLTPLLAENDEVAKNWYNQVAPQPNMTSFTWCKCISRIDEHGLNVGTDSPAQ
jgi:hypothetical protein